MSIGDVIGIGMCIITFIIGAITIGNSWEK